ncbi:MAG: M20/M25/M40 family metallo-hydrolase [Anaerolineae bacterium]|nr:M20/M25/M40 family metallo-hydrolase [Anaerolineae bacterium]
MSKQRKAWLWLVIGLGLMGLACSLSTELPPTLVPSTPIATITPEQAFAPPTLAPQPFAITPPPQAPAATPVNIIRPYNLDQVSTERMMGNINTLVSFESRHVLSTASTTTGIAAAERWITNQLNEIRASSPFPDIRIDVYAHQFQYEFAGQQLIPSNVIMAVTGTDAAAGVVIIGAHYDTMSQAWTTGDNYQPGANDNASGVSAVLEIARHMVMQRNRATLVFVFFAAEETGRQGSLAFVNDYIKVQNIPVVAVFNLDSIGSPLGVRGERFDNKMRLYSEGPNDGANSRQLARMVHFAALNYLPNMVVEVRDATDRSGRWGDHMSFSDVGYPAVRLVEGADDPLVFHTPRDTVDRVDPLYLQRTTQVALAAVELMANGPNPPTLKPLRPSATDPASLTLEWSYSPFCASYIIALRRPDSLVYDRFFSVEGGALSVSSGEFKNYGWVTVGCVDTQGRLGRLAPELPVPTS